MQVPAPFEYERATSVDHAIGLLERLGSEARLVAGGHSLLPMMKLRLANLEYLIDINDLHDELGYIRVEADQVRIGAMTRHRELLESDALAGAFPIFRDAERVIADPVVRNRGTLGGSLCQADPSEDLSAVCTTLDASCVIRGAAGERVVDDGGVPPRPVRDRGRRRRDAHRDPAPDPARRLAAPTRRSSAGPATGPSSRRRRGLAGRRRRSPTPGSAWPRSARTPPASRPISEALRGQAPVRGAVRRRPAPSPPRAASRPPTSAAAPTTSATSPTSSPDGRCAEPVGPHQRSRRPDRCRSR